MKVAQKVSNFRQILFFSLALGTKILIKVAAIYIDDSLRDLNDMSHGMSQNRTVL